ncbi:MAG: hypothetical protein ACI4SS_03235 [Clostridia bacterium]
MTTLEKYEFKYVNVVETNGRQHLRKYVNSFTSAADNDDENEESIGLIPAKESKCGIELFASEIKSIELAE